ncbi:MAG: cofactor-independent phosphoglycerate mutase [Sedimentisphaerales bacterium]|nr:cofactor-independent phosphoglycerate mutase [Sedimentisphaerales bacterium]
MKYAVIIMDGAADEPIEELQGQTVLERAHIPYTDTVSRTGRQGLVRTVPEGFPPGSDVAQMSIMGYEAKDCYSGRAPLEAAAQGIETDPSDWIFRCNLVTTADGVMLDHSAGHIQTVQAAQLIKDINEKLGSEEITFYPGVSYRHLMVHRGGPFDCQCTPPHDILDQPYAKHLPHGKNAKQLCHIMEQAQEILANHDINTIRAELNENQATNIWLWGQGHRPQMESFQKKYGVKGSIITAVDVLRGIGKLIGLKVLNVEGATGYLDTNYIGKGQAAIEALEAGDDIIIVHVEAPDEAGHGALLQEKIQAVEQIDKHIVGPLLQWLQNQDEWRIMVLPDHPTPVRLRTHVDQPVPVALAGTNITSHLGETYSEANAAKGGLRISHGHELMEYFLFGKG